MVARILANLLVMGSTVMVRAFAQAYRQALANASKNGVAQEGVQNIKRGSKMMTEAEARQILGVSKDTTWEEVLKRYDNLFEETLRTGLSFSNQRFTEPKRVWKVCTN